MTPTPQLVPVDGAVRVTARHSLFRFELDQMFVPAGATMAALVEAAFPDGVERDLVHASLIGPDGDEWPVPSDRWTVVRPKPGIELRLVVVPRGRGTGRILGMALMLAIAVAAAVVFPPSAFAAGGWLGLTLGTTAASIASAVAIGLTTIAGSLLIGALIPMDVPRLGDLRGTGGGELAKTSPTLVGSSNAARPWAPVPRVYGRYRVTPPKAARDVTETVGNVTYLRCLFDFGYGPLELSDIRIGTTPIAQFDGVESEIIQGWPDDDSSVALYPSAIRQDSYSLKVSAAGGPQVIESRDTTVELGIDLTFPAIYRVDRTQGDLEPTTVGVRLEYRRVGDAAWTPWADDAITPPPSAGSYIQSYRTPVPSPGRFEVRITRTTSDNETSQDIRDIFYVTALRSFQPGRPVLAKGRCLLALRIRATDQLNGTIQDLSAIAEALLPVWNGTAWAYQKTRTPAWAYLDVLRGSANRFPVADQRIQLADFVAWAARTDAVQPDGGPKQTFDGVIDTRSTVFQTLSDIASAGRAAPAMREGRFSIVEDVPQTVPIQHFTPRNSWGFVGTKLFAEAWQGLRVRYVDPDRDWQQSEVVVYADGYTEANATRVDTLDLFGVTRRAQALREGRYHLAAATLRPELYELNCDVENLLCTRGDLVRVTHDVPLWGSGWGRVKSLTMAGPDVAAIVLDELVPVRDDRAYVVRWRTADAAGDIAPVTVVATGIDGDTDSFTFTSPRATSAAPAVGDLVMVGEQSRESAALIVKAIEPGPNLTAKLVLVDAAPDIHAADSGPIPAFDPLITQPVTPTRRLPLPPVLGEVFSGTAALALGSDGTVLARIGIRLRPADGDLQPAVFQLRWRLVGAGEWEAVAGPGPTLFTGPVADGATYEVQARSVTAAGLAGSWTDLVQHQVAGKAAPPSDVQGFVISGRRLDWDAVADLDLAGYRIRWAPGNSIAWGQAQPAHGGLLTSSPFELDALPTGQITILIKAVDTSGNESANAARIVTNLGDTPITGAEAALVDFKAGGFTGTTIDATVSGGDLLADSDGSALMWSAAAAPMWGDEAADMWPGAGWLKMAYEDDLAFTSPPAGSRVLLRHTLEGDGVAIFYRVVPPMWAGTGDPMWTADGNPMWGGGVLGQWIAWPGALVDPPDALQLRVEIGGGASRGAIRRLQALLDAPRIDEAFADIAIASGGTRLPIAQAYSGIGAVTVTLQGGSTALSAKIIDKNPTLGPLIQCFDASGTGVAATVDAVITGY